MNELTIFQNENFGQVRTLTIDGEPWFVGKDVAQALGYTNPQKAIRDHVDDEDKGVNELFTPGGTQEITIVNESGLYSLIMSSKLPSAKEFKRWVTSEVLPAIRKTGRYEFRQPELTTEQIIECADILSRCNKENIKYVLHFLKNISPDIEVASYNKVLPDKSSVPLEGAEVPFDYLTFSNMLHERYQSLSQFSSVIGCSSTSVSKWKSGKVKPCRYFRNLICDTLEVQTGYFDISPRRRRRYQNVQSQSCVD